MKKSLLFLLAAMFLLASCAPQGMRMVDSKDDAAFASMYRAMAPSMLKRHMVDERGSWYAPLISLGPDDVGRKLLDSMSPRFCSAELGEPAARSFREMLTSQDVVKVGPWSASIQTSEHTVSLKLIAVTDWDGDGRNDWLVSCRIGHRNTPHEAREYFILIADPESSVLHPHVLMERLHDYSRVTILYDNSFYDFLAPKTVEVEQGEADVTLAPEKKLRGFEPTTVRSSSLNE